MSGSTKGKMKHSLTIVCEPIMDTTNSKNHFFGRSTMDEIVNCFIWLAFEDLVDCCYMCQHLS